MSSYSSFLSAVLALHFVLSASAATTDWSQWRGAKRDGIVQGESEGARWPDSLDASTLKQIWRIELGKSYSGPIVSGNVVFTTETIGDEKEGVRAFDLANGSQKWSAEWEGMMRVPFFARKNGSWIRSTPATDGASVFVAGMRDVLLCFDAKTGDERWRVDFPKKIGSTAPAFGFVSSPLLVGEHVIVQAGEATFCLKKSSGEVVWKSLEDGGGMNGSAFSSPLLAELKGSRQLLVQTRKELCGLAPDTGEILWRREVPAFRGMNILTPVVHGDTLFTSTYGGKAFGFGITKEATGWKCAPRWELKQQGYMSTPIVIDGHAYLHLRNQKLACINLNEGKNAWVTNKKFGEYWSMVAQGNKILTLDEDGTLRLIRANPQQFELISERTVSKQDTWAHIAVSGTKVIVRELEALTVFEWKKS